MVSVNTFMGLEHCWNCNCKHLRKEVSGFHAGIRVGSRWACQGERDWARLSVVFFGDAFGNQCHPILSLLTLVQEPGLRLRYLSVIWSGTGSLVVKRTGASFRDDWRTLWIRATGWIREAQSAKRWARTHKKQGPCIRGSREDRGNVDPWLKICAPLVLHRWDSVSRDCEEQHWMAGGVPGGPFPILHCSTSMMHQSKRVRQEKGTFSTTIQGICMNTWRILELLYIKKKKKNLNWNGSREKLMRWYGNWE